MVIARKPLIILAAVLAVAALVISIFLLSKERGAAVAETAPLLRIEAEKTSDAGLELGSAFLITGEGGAVSLREAEDLLRLEPAFAYHWEETPAALLLRPDAPLAPDTVYRFSARYGPPQSWAFQTAGRFGVYSVRPSANADHVPLAADIEISFSRPAENITAWAEIEPAVPGGWRQSVLTAVFLPGAMLAPDTLYTVTVRAGLPSLTGETLAEDHSFSFRTEHSGGTSEEFLEVAGSFTESFLPGDPAAIRFTALSGNFAGARVVAAVYRVEDSAAYLTLALTHAGQVAPVCGRDSDAPAELPETAVPEAFIEGVLQETAVPGALYFLPAQTPAPGYYLLDMTVAAGGESALRRQKLICVSALSVYLQNLNGQTQFWLNDAASGRPLAGAEVMIGPAGQGSSLTAVTSVDGLAALDTGAAAEAAPLTVRAADGRSWADLVPLAAGAPLSEDTPPSRRYYSYLYFDRAAYLPADTAHFWGYLAPRQEIHELPAEVTVSFPGLPPQTAAALQGVFSGDFDWRGLAPGEYDVTVSAADGVILTSRLLITDERKPAYIIKAAAAKNIYRRGEKSAFTATAAFFDGSPAAGMRLTAENSAASQSQVVSAFGAADFSLPEPEPETWRPYRENLSLRADGNENGGAFASVSIYRFPTDYMCEVKTEAAPGGFFLDVSTARIDLAAAEAALAAGGETALSAADFAERIRGEAYEQYFDAGIIRCEYLREETGEYYDFLQDRTVRQYRYVYRESIVDRLSFRTTGGRYRSELLPWPSGDLVSYKISLDYETPDGVVLREYDYSAPLLPAQTESEPDHYFLAAEKTNFSIGEKLSLSLQNRTGSLPRGGRLFYAVTRDEAVITDVTGEAAFGVYCSEALLPNFSVCAAYFDGKHVFPLDPLAFNYDPAERELRVEILPEEENYEPGAALTAEIRVTDALGQPRQASFALSAADEAAFAALEQKPDAAAAFYRPVYGEAAGQFSSYTPHSFATAATAGGQTQNQTQTQIQTQVQAPSEGRREDFRPAAAFLSGRTDGSGRARVTCPLPDDITTWRLTAVAFTEDGYAGDARAVVAATPRLVLRPALSSRYTVQDDIALALRAEGIPPETAVSYSARAEGAGGEAAERTVSGEAGAYAVCDFGKLPAGEYKFYITATAAGEWRDEAVYPFRVTAGLQDTPLLTESDAADLGKTEPPGYPVDLFFYDRSHALYGRALAKLAGAAGARADELAAEEFIRVSFPGMSAGAQARDGLSTPETESAPAGAPVLRPETGRLPAEYVDAGGGLRLLPYSGPDSLLTARAVAAAPGCLDPERTRDYFYGILHSDATPEETAAAYLGLSALGAPVLTDIRLTLPNERAEFTLRDCLRLAAGLALLGDGAGAAAWYEEFIAPLTVAAGGALRVDAGEGDAVSYALTAESALLARLIGHSHADALLTYVLEQDGGDYSPLLDIIAVLRFMPAPAGGGASLRYNLDGKNIQVDLSDIPASRLRLGQSQFAAADFRAEGAAGVAALYPGAEGGLSSDDSGKITIERSYAAHGGLVRVTIDVRLQNNAPLALYTLTDTLPAGLRFVSAEAEEGDNWYLSEEDGGRVTFVLNRVRENSGAQVDILADFQVTYLARAALTGEFLAGGAVARHAGSGLWAATPPSLQTFQLAR